MTASQVMEVLTEVQKIAQSSNPYKTAVTAGLTGSIRPGMLRSVYWKVFLGLLPVPRSKPTGTTALLESWEEAMDARRKELISSSASKAASAAANSEREAAASAKKKKTRFGDSDEDEDDADIVKKDNPLSTHASSAYAKQFQRQKLEETIEKDMGRLWSDDPFFEDDFVKQNMKNILLEFCDEDRDEEGHIAGYRQGMHEILSLIYYVVHRDADLLGNLKPKLNELNEEQEDDLSILQAICAHSAVMRDSHLIFARIMSTKKGLGLVTWYHGAVSSPKTAEVGQSALKMVGGDSTDNIVVDVANDIQLMLLKQVDEHLWRKMNKELDIQSTSYLLRWLRLLFLREFSFAQVACIWDAILAEYSWRVCEEDEESTYTLQDSIVPHIAVSMLQFVSQEIINSDFAFALRRLMRYPPVEDTRPIISKSLDRKHRGTRIALIAGVMPQSHNGSASTTSGPLSYANPLYTPTGTSGAAANNGAATVSPTTNLHMPAFLSPPVQPSGAVPSSSSNSTQAVAPTRPSTSPSSTGAPPALSSASASSGFGQPPPLAASFGGVAVPPPLHGGARPKFEVETVSALRDRQIRQGMALSSIIRRFESKWFPAPGRVLTPEEEAKQEEEYLLAIAELKKVRDVLLNSVQEA